MDVIPLVTSSTILSVESFWSAVLVYHTRPNLVNKKLSAVSPALFCQVSLYCPKVKRLSEIFTWESVIYEFRRWQDKTKITTNFIKSITETHDKEAVIEEVTFNNFKDTLQGQFVSVRILLPRKSIEKCVEIVIFDKDKKTVTYVAVQEQEAQVVAPRFPYHLQLSETGNLRVLVNNFEDADSSSAVWLVEKLFPKLLKWAENDDKSTTIQSLSLVVTEDYCDLYARLKNEYGDNLVTQWSKKANTNPQKYVFEDLAIAAYLICLWKELKQENVNFVDCGCGNGLLVYILNKKGYKGYGLDIRSRDIWDLFKNEADLRIGTITPETTFPEATWLIGNHSDELTPWIPIIALNGSPKTNYFVLPCCPYDLNGRKYIRTNTAVSQYEDYLNYVKNISEMCGFVTSVDKLRIPSTKRTCLVGIRNVSVAESVKIEVSQFTKKKVNADFVPRNAVEQVRNCTSLSKDLIKRIIAIVVDRLLQNQYFLSRDFGQEWNKGGTVTLNELVEILSAEDKKQLKNECGGLQTLLKNHRYIFEVVSGKVSLRKPPSLSETEKYKDKPCWFHENHPQGCFYTSEICAYNHK